MSLSSQNSTTSRTGQRRSARSKHRSQRNDSSPSFMDAELRKRLADQRNPNAPQFVYHLYVTIQFEGDPIFPPCLLRTYVSHPLASYDALCWVLEEQWKAGAQFSSCTMDYRYDAESQGRCRRYCTDPRLRSQLGKEFTAWTTEDRLL